MANLVSAIENGIVSNTTNKRLHDLEKQQEELERQILVERSKQSVKVPESEIRRFYAQALKAESRALINLLIKEIVLYNDKIEIHYNNPTTKSPDESQGFLFYSADSKDKNRNVSSIKRQNKKPKRTHFSRWFNLGLKWCRVPEFIRTQGERRSRSGSVPDLLF